MAAKVKGLAGAHIYYEKDVDRSAIADRNVAILGYGSQSPGHLVRCTYADAIGGARAGVIETLIEAGYQPDVVYLECLHELKVIVNADTKAEMKQIITEIQDGTFAKNWVAEARSGRAKFSELKQAGFDHLIETSDKELNAMMPCIPVRVFLRFCVLMGRSRRVATRRA